MSAATLSRIRVWDAPTRLFHWSMAACFIGAYLTRESEGGLWHLLFGYTLAALVLFRLVWGVVGTRYARFREFIRGPGAVIGYARGLFGQGDGRHYLGHNPLGALAVIALLLLGIGMGITGWLMAANGAEGNVKEVHKALANAFLALVIAHVVGVPVSSWRHRENLPRAMVTGVKQGAADAGIRGNAVGIALLLLLAIAAFWGWSWKAQRLPFGLSATAEMGEAGEHGKSSTHRDEDDEGEADDD